MNNDKDKKLDDLIMNGNILLSVWEIVKENGCTIGDAKVIFKKRYDRLRKDNPLGFKATDDQYFKDVIE